ncbi:hypothetical protein H2199_008737 [Coniosporium tulheliwenetii]|uniref:Uncharacterized protein n=1 Tax=Coniosporium tulheliwenetii TaxID=3383036 RepID=A0ACC2YJ58_9PEZI|nr:hypothetical protein H2199_008737 [Cladosporium sp. JES 115]
MGTPHQGGSGVALGRLMVNIASVFVPADDRLLRHLERDSEWLQQQLGQYGLISGDFMTKFAFEEYATPTVLGHSIMVVPRASAVVPGAADAEPIVIHADHINIVKFGSKSDEGYRKVSGHLRVMAASAGDVVGSRWDTEGRVNAARTNEPAESFEVNFSIPEVPEIEYFVGRDEELTQIYERLKNSGSRKTVVLHGLGGMGKTQLAVTYAKRHRDEYSAVFWLNSKDVDTLKQGFVSAAKRIFRDHPSLTYLKAVVESGNLDEAVDTIKRWLSNSKNNRWLLVYDNYDTPKLPECHEPGAFDIKSFLPEGHQGAVIITTRSSQLKVGHLIPVKKLQNIDRSLEILSHASGRQGLSNGLDKFRRLSSPLQEIVAAAPAEDSAAAFYEDRALYSTWELSLDHVRRQNELSAKLLQLWAYFDNQDIWLELLQECNKEGPEWFSKLTQDQLSFDEAVRVLCDHALVEPDATSGNKSEESMGESMGYSMHSCVHSWTIHVLNREWDLGIAELALSCVGWHIPSSNRPKYWIIQQRLIRHANRCWHLISSGLAGADDDVSTFDRIHCLGMLYSDQGKLGEAEEMFQRALQGYEAALGAEHTLTLSTVGNLGNLYRDQGKLGEAEEMYQRALAGKEKALGVEHTSTLRTVNNLGILYDDQAVARNTTDKAPGMPVSPPHTSKEHAKG